jgi:hypothetical protein
MAEEAGFDVKLQVTEFARALDMLVQQAFYQAWM